jgi:GNAT superfamily N-acetyltransferase
VVAQAFQRRGIGHALVTWVHAWAAAHGVTQIDVSVAAFTTAARRYSAQLGSTTVWHRMRYALPHPTPPDDDRPG